ncbi:MAG: hypothetical protein GY811_09170 [Myxococcales bacterium]|nr:hypothetical protein [Myxococcales bacterium]
MGGCTNCSGKSACEDHKGEMLDTVAQWMDKLYPTRIWGQPNDAVAIDAGVGQEDVMALAEELSTELKGATIFREGGEGDACDYVYVLCQGRETCGLQVRYGGAELPLEWDTEHALCEFYLRVSISTMAPLAVVQQVAVTVTREEGEWMISEELASGVYDAPLLKRFQRLVALLPAYGLTHLDLGEISAPPRGYDDGQYQALFGRPAHRVNYLFFREPSAMSSTGPLLAFAT